MPILNSHSDQADGKNNHFGGFEKVDASATNGGFGLVGGLTHLYFYLYLG